MADPFSTGPGRVVAPGALGLLTGSSRLPPKPGVPGAPPNAGGGAGGPPAPPSSGGVGRSGASHFAGAPAAGGYLGAFGAGGKPKGPLANMYGWGANPFATSASGTPRGASASATPAATPPPYGSQSGPTAIEDRYNQRANGTDPGWEYATGRATDAINNQSAQRGGYNSSSAVGAIGDMFANATSQREGQLDTLANEATGAHQNALNSMFVNGESIANGSSGAGQAYGMGGGGAIDQNTQNQINLTLAKYGVDPSSSEGAALIKLIQAGSSGAGQAT